MMPEETAQAADDCASRYYRGMPDALCWQNTAGTIRTSGWQLAKDVVAFSHANAGRTGVGR